MVKPDPEQDHDHVEVVVVVVVVVFDPEKENLTPDHPLIPKTPLKQTPITMTLN